MNKILPEKEFQHSIMAALEKSGYEIRTDMDFDPALAMDRELLFRFLSETQPEEMAALRKLYKEQTEETVVRFLNAEMTKEGGSLLSVLRHGVSVAGRHLSLMYTKPATDFNRDLVKKYERNIFSVAEEVWANDKERVDLVIFLNGLAIMSFELKSNLSGQSYEDAIYQYRHDRDPKTRLFLFKAGCLVHFAMDLERVYMTTHLAGEATFFLPFNRGKGSGMARGAGNELDPKTGLGVAYMWEDILQKDTVLDLVSKFLYIEMPDSKRKAEGHGKAKKGNLIFPRYHQLDCIRRVLADVAEHGTSRNYLIQHSAGSGKTNTITWLAHRLASFHDASNRQVFDNIIIVTDRVIVDRQLQRAVLALEHKEGLIRVMDESCRSADLARALSGNTKIIATTIQKFPYIVDSVKGLSDKHFAVIIDEAHSSTAGRNMAAVTKSLGAAEEPDLAQDAEDLILDDIKSCGKPENVSFFAFTATPKPTTLHFFGRLNAHGQYEAFHLYSMKQAIEEGFILDVLSTYTTYATYFEVQKAKEEDPEYKKAEAMKKIRQLALLSAENIDQRVRIIADHFRASVMSELGGAAKAMVITSSRLEAVRYKLAMDAYLAERGYTDMKALVAFSGKVKDGETEYTETGMNGFSEAKTAAVFDAEGYRLLLVADKYQTGFDQPKLCAMYIMKKLFGVNAVQTLSRLNRICPPYEKQTFVLDFANSYEDMQKAFAPYYETTLLAESVTPERIYELSDRLEAYYVFDPYDIDCYNEILYNPSAKSGLKSKLVFYLNRAKQKADKLDKQDRIEFADTLRRFCRFYEFLLLLSGIEDTEIHKKYRFASDLKALLNEKRPGGGISIDDKIKATHFINEQTGEYKGKKLIADPFVRMGDGERPDLPEAQKERLSKIIDEINSRMGKHFDRDVAFKSLLQIKDILMKSESLKLAAKHNTKSNFEMAFASQTDDALIAGLAQNREFYGLLLNDEEIKKTVLGVFVNEVYRELRAE